MGYSGSKMADLGGNPFAQLFPSIKEAKEYTKVHDNSTKNTGNTGLNSDVYFGEVA